MSPADTTPEKPMPRVCAQSRMAVTKAPLCEINAVPPGFAGLRAKVASSCICGAMMPRQLGPTTRSKCGFAASSIFCRRPLAWVIPAEMTTAQRVPISPRSAITPGTVSAGVITTARSGGEGRSLTAGTQAMPPRSTRRGFTAWIEPANPRASTFSSTTAPSVPGRDDAPIRARLRGWSRADRLRIVMARLASGVATKCRKRHGFGHS